MYYATKAQLFKQPIGTMFFITGKDCIDPDDISVIVENDGKTIWSIRLDAADTDHDDSNDQMNALCHARNNPGTPVALHFNSSNRDCDWEVKEDATIGIYEHGDIERMIELLNFALKHTPAKT